MNWRLLAISRESFSLVRGKNVRIRNSRGRSAGRRRAGGLQQRLQPARSRGDAARYFDPQEVESIARVVEDVWKNAPAASKAQAQSRRFNYLDSAAELLEALRKPPAGREAPRLREIAVLEPPLASIVTPSYQQGRFLRQCIESVLAQDYRQIEYFILDGGSTDESREILKRYDGRFFWKSERDGGQTSAINSGLQLAKGSILAFLNSDDLLLPGAVSTIVAEWRRQPSVDLFYGRANTAILSANTIRASFNSRSSRAAVSSASRPLSGAGASWIA